MNGICMLSYITDYKKNVRYLIQLFHKDLDDNTITTHFGLSINLL